MPRGGSGFIGTAALKACGHNVTIISRMPGAQRITWLDIEKNGLPKNVNAIVNLAGQNVLDPTRRWTPGFKQNVWNSRINSTTSLAKAIAAAENKPDVFVNIVGVSHYQPSETVTYNETHPGTGFDFMSRLCMEWEKAAQIPDPTRLVLVRTGAVIGREGGMIKSLVVPFFFGVGGPVGSGKQYLPWIHVEDLTNLIQFAIQRNGVKGVVNGVAPHLV